MRVVVIGGAGTIGRAVVARLADRHDMVIVGRRSGTVRVDLESADSVRNMYQELGAFDAVVCAAGEAHFGAFEDLTEQDLALAIESKLLGQIRLVLYGHSLIADGGSFTLVSGYIFDDPIPEATSFAVANGGIEGFVRAASLSLPRGIRINAVSPGLAADSAEVFGPFNPGRLPVPMGTIASAFERSVEGRRTGEILRPW